MMIAVVLLLPMLLLIGGGAAYLMFVKVGTTASQILISVTMAVRLKWLLAVLITWLGTHWACVILGIGPAGAQGHAVRTKQEKARGLRVYRPGFSLKGCEVVKNFTPLGCS